MRRGKLCTGRKHREEKKTMYYIRAELSNGKIFKPSTPFIQREAAENQARYLYELGAVKTWVMHESGETVYIVGKIGVSSLPESK